MRRKLTDKDSRQAARRTLDSHWEFVRRLAREGAVHFCVWNKYHHKEQRNEARHGLIDGLEFLAAEGAVGWQLITLRTSCLEN